MSLPLVLLSMMACEVDQARLARPADAEAPTLDAPPPPAAGPEREALYQLLFAGELGGHAQAKGQRARMLAWFHSLELTPEQLRGLADLSAKVGARADRIAAVEATVSEQEAAALAPVYDALITLLADEGAPQPDALAAAATALADARAEVPSNTLLRMRHDELRGMLADARSWIGGLAAAQQSVVGSSRFLLRHRVGALTAPGDHGDLLGTVWDGASFDSLVLGRVPEDTKPLDIGGLWATESVRNTPDHHLGAVQKQVLVLLAARQPGLPAAIEVALGTRAPLDFSPQPLGEAPRPISPD